MDWRRPRDRTAVGRLLLPASLILIVLQFVWAFARPGPPPNLEFPLSLLVMVPVALFMTSLYLLFSKREVLKGRGKIARFIILLLASYTAAGGVFILLIVVGLIAFGPRAVEALFSHMLWILALGTIVAFPLVARGLR